MGRCGPVPGDSYGARPLEQRRYVVVAPGAREDPRESFQGCRHQGWLQHGFADLQHLLVPFLR